ncbi:MarR family transcriptional regulator [Nakamurella flavida]|uniref:MarR family transcriptional regulator n=1 Tax=Nakamurella flavida TaxID=363630 RepID=A0A938YGX6_9ACTN|nr:helix-turn-helix domain-containing protein [Nakamurella flavida]MBM9477485.1 MarR family transcriptional regulator [Nakamurella flavida]MDP9777418.1 DNA-binding Lrp family transcriptional regulator [Nakamurella flavida]
MDDDTLLAVIHRGRPATVGEIAALAHLDPTQVGAAVDRLQARGVLEVRDGRIDYRHPADWAAQAAAASRADVRARVADGLGDLERIVTALPGMLRHFAVGEVSTDLVPVTIRHGEHASEDLWFDTAQHDSGTLDAVLPAIERFLATSPERRERFGRALAAKDTVRVIVPTSSLGDPAARDRMDRYTRAGLAFRSMQTPPSWFWVDGDQVSMPFEWGEGRPTSVLGIRNAALADLTRAYFAEIWQRADPPAGGEPAWTPLLRLMRQGITLETASRTLGINPRTGRRRVAAAMEHYGVATLFALGVACRTDLEHSG